jgi:hypothetical protein
MGAPRIMQYKVSTSPSLASDEFYNDGFVMQLREVYRIRAVLDYSRALSLCMYVLKSEIKLNSLTRSKRQSL